MKGYGRKVFAVVISFILAFATPITSLADNETMIKREGEVSGKTMLVFDTTEATPTLDSSTSTANVTLKVKRESDTFQVLQLAQVKWTKKIVSNQVVVSALIEWVPEVEAWLVAHDYKDGDKAISPLQFGENERSASADEKERELVDLLSKMQADTELMSALSAKYLAAAHISTTNANDGNTDGTKGYDGKTESTPKQATVRPSMLAETYNGSYDIDGLQYGIYMVAADKDKTSNKKYQPLMIPLIPEQTGPTGHWYMNDSTTETLKYEEIGVTKVVNATKPGLALNSSGAYDIVGAAEIVDFEVAIDIPKYPLKEGSVYESTLFNAFDIMEGGYRLIATSARIEYEDAYGNRLHPQAVMEVDSNGNMLAHDGKEGTSEPKTYDAILACGAVAYVNTATGADPDEEVGFYSVYNEALDTTNYYGKVNGKLVTLGTSKKDAVSQYNNEAGKTYDYTKLVEERLDMDNPESPIIYRSFISCGFSYVNMMGQMHYSAKSSDMIYFSDAQEAAHSTGSVFEPVKLYVIYSAQITDQSYLGSDNNTNHVFVTYTKDSGGNGDIGVIDEETRVWTYGLNLVKIDGEKKDLIGQENLEDPTEPYLAGAKFELYRLDSVYCYVPGAEETLTVPVETDYSKYTWYRGQDRALTSYEEVEADWEKQLQKVIKYSYTSSGVTDQVTIGTAIDTLKAATLSKYTSVLSKEAKSVEDNGWKTANKFDQKYAALYEQNDGKYAGMFNEYSSEYKRIIVAEKVNVENPGPNDSKDTCTKSSKEHYHLYVYVMVKDDIESVKTAEGITINGLDVGTYLLKETAAPGGYNTLSNDIIFEINQYTEAQATAAATSEIGKSYKGFISDTTDDMVTGIYPLVIENYKGLKLPSTGGMGTLLFTIIGIVIMLASMILVIIKRRKALLQSALSILLVMTLAISFNGLEARAERTIGSNSTEYGTSVRGANNKVSFTVECKNQGDTIEVYKLGVMDWDNAAETYVGPTWIGGITEHMAAGKTMVAYKDYDTPEKLGTADPKVQVDFLNDAYSYFKTYGSSYARTEKASLVEPVGTTWRISDVEYGIYLIKAKGSNGKEYQPLTVNAIPTQEGPFGTWYLQDNISASLKYSDVKVYKTIDEEGYKIVTQNEEVDFQLRAEVPSYPPYQVENEDGEMEDSYAGYYFGLVDTMSSAFELKTDDYKIADNLEVKYLIYDTETETDKWDDISSTDYEIIFAKKAESNKDFGVVSYSSGKSNKIYALYQKNETDSKYYLTWYYLNEEKGKLVKLFTNNIGITSKSDINYPADISNTTLLDQYEAATGTRPTQFVFDTDTNEWKDIMAVTFDFDAIRERGGNQTPPKEVRVNYKATVTDAAAVGEDTNTNKVSLFFQKDIAGTIDEKEAVVYAWTYAVNITKVDGDKDKSKDPSAYLEGAEFKLYKEAYLYVPMETLPESKSLSDYESYEWKSSFDGSESAPTFKASAEAEPVTLSDLKTAMSKLDDVYLRIIEVPAGTCDKCSQTDVHNHYMIYDLYQNYSNVSKNGTITSVASAEGVTIKGLEPASYVLIEINPPTGYNLLNEAVRFEIMEATDDQAKLINPPPTEGPDKDKISKKGFVSDIKVSEGTVGSVKGEDDNYYLAFSDGTYKVEVKNFKGLTLPSTGGMGTLLFTIIGIVVMSGAFFLVIAKRRRMAR